MKPEISGAKAISDRVIKAAWKKVSTKPLPDIYAYSLTDEAFDSAMKSLQKKKGAIDTRMEEYGVDFDNELIEALTFEFEENIIIFVKQSVPLADALNHELKHVAKWIHLDKHVKHA